MVNPDINSPQWEQIWETLKAFFQDNICAIFLDIENQPELYGSGTLVSIGNRLFVITAAHVIKGCNKDQLRIGSLRLNHYYFEILGMNWIGGDEDEKEDLAWVEVSAPTGANVRGLLTESNMVRTIDFSRDEYFVSGFPGSLVKRFKNGFVNQTNLTVFGFLTGLVDIGDWPNNLQPDYDIVLEYPEGFYDTKENELKTPPAPGLSGGGIWLAELAKSQIWSTDQLKLVGVEIAWHKNIHQIYGIQMRHWIDFLVKDKPELSQYF